ncbi:acyl-CoA dehydrogenase family protein [Sphingomonas immobilis]|uniref:Acyl-CoA dehydrogenase family protein n=1 Tax=Sphingomonas immobilis TaxID=3063997 RepID=A0ABT8ZZZ9_9SPHN|nr:acyl-CoA dehydrogenase family protein [Sphingomonas sp. CA1-15]MDO7843163.1 acyl-CoA dehydrogenase family protein [Sphingomonas sp. CA1-15]
MNDVLEILTETATRLFEQKAGDDAARAARRGELPESVWDAVAEIGLPFALMPEEAGGFGLAEADALRLIRIGGGFGSPVPLGETMLANAMLAAAGLPPADRIATFAELEDAHVVREGDGWRVSGRASGVPWARHAGTITLLGGGHIIAARVGDLAVTPGEAGNGLARDDLEIDARLPADQVAPRPARFDADAVEAAGALMRALEMAGALQTVLALTVQYAGERIQFGKPIAKLQAIQQQLAVVADQCAAANAAAELAADAWDGDTSLLGVAVAKARVGEAAGIAASIAHQVHGAIGFTEEHRLHLFTKALWSWRDEFGSETVWQRRLGKAALAAPGDGFWPFITAPTVLEQAA